MYGGVPSRPHLCYTPLMRPLTHRPALAPGPTLDQLHRLLPQRAVLLPDYFDQRLRPAVRAAVWHLEHGTGGPAFACELHTLLTTQSAQVTALRQQHPLCDLLVTTLAGYTQQHAPALAALRAQRAAQADALTRVWQRVRSWPQALFASRGDKGV